MRVVFVRSMDDTRKQLHEAGKEAAKKAVGSVCRVPCSSSVVIGKDTLGKPFASINSVPVALSISHSYPFALAIAAREHLLLGADIERIRNFPPSTWEAFLTVQEKALIAAAPPQKQNYLRTLFWSLKESALKAFGVGLRTHPQRVDVSRLLMKTGGSKHIEMCGILYPTEVHMWRMGGDFVATAIALSQISGYDTSTVCHESSRYYRSNRSRNACCTRREGARRE